MRQSLLETELTRKLKRRGPQGSSEGIAAQGVADARPLEEREASESPRRLHLALLSLSTLKEHVLGVMKNRTWTAPRNPDPAAEPVVEPAVPAPKPPPELPLFFMLSHLEDDGPVRLDGVKLGVCEAMGLELDEPKTGRLRRAAQRSGLPGAAPGATASSAPGAAAGEVARGPVEGLVPADKSGVRVQMNLWEEVNDDDDGGGRLMHTFSESLNPMSLGCVQGLPIYAVSRYTFRYGIR